MKYDSIIFDLDGTLWDASYASSIGWNNALNNLGIDKTITPEDIRSISGKPYDECIEILLPDIKVNTDSLYDELNRCEKTSIQETGGNIYHDAAYCLENLLSAYNLFIISNCEEWYLEEFLKFSDFKKYLVDWNCYGRSGNKKKRMLLDMKEKYKSHNPVYVGDTEGDYISSKDAGIEFFHITHGFGIFETPGLKFENLRQLSDYLMKN